jgi:hypothetical protein
VQRGGSERVEGRAAAAHLALSSSVLHKSILCCSTSIPRLLTGLAWLLLLRERVGYAAVVDGDGQFAGWGLAIVC